MPAFFFNTRRKLKEPVIISAVRTPIGKFQGSLKSVSATQLGATVVKAAVERAGVQCVFAGYVNRGAEEGGIAPSTVVDVAKARAVVPCHRGEEKPVRLLPRERATDDRLGEFVIGRRRRRRR